MGRRATAWLCACALALSGRAVAQQGPLLESPARITSVREVDDTPPRQTSAEPAIAPVRYTDKYDDRTPAGSTRDDDREFYDPLSDFVNGKSRYGRQAADKRSSDKFGDGFKDLFNPDKPKEWLFSDHAFDGFATPISSPFLFEDPRALTEVRPLFMYQQVPTKQPNFHGGNIWFLGTRASIAFTERLSLTLNKLGGIDVSTAGSSPLPGGFGFAELWLGPKYTFYRDATTGTIAAGGIVFQIPTGNDKTFQNTGNLSLVPYVSVGKTLHEFKSGTLNSIANMGYSFGTNKERSDYFYLNGHLDYDVGNFHRFYPLMEFNYTQYAKNGTANAIAGEGRDLINFGSASKGSGLVSGTLGARFKITEAAQVGAGFEIPLFGNRDFLSYRFTVDFIFRY